MCYDEGVLQEWLDGEYVGDALAIRRHTQECPKCHAVLERLKLQEEAVGGALQLGLSPERAYAQIGADKKNTITRKRLTMKRLHWSIKTAAAAVLCGVLFLTAPGTALADQFLSLFRTENIKAVAITQQDIYELENMFERGEGSLEIDKIGTFETTSQGKETVIEALDDVAVLKGHMPGMKVVPAPEGMKYKRAVLVPKTAMQFTLQVGPINDLLKAMGKDVNLPESLEGKPFSIAVDNGLGYSMESIEGQGQVHIAVSSMPVLGLPEGMNPRDIVTTLQKTGLLPDSLSEKLVGLDDLESVMPVPYIEDRQTKTERQINGNNAVVLTEKNGDWFTIFMKDGDYLYIFSGSGIAVDDVVKMIELQE